MSLGTTASIESLRMTVKMDPDWASDSLLLHLSLKLKTSGISDTKFSLVRGIRLSWRMPTSRMRDNNI